VTDLLAAIFVAFNYEKHILSIYSRGGESAGQMRPASKFDMTRISILVTQFRVESRAKTKLHDKQVLKIACHKKTLSLELR